MPINPNRIRARVDAYLQAPDNTAKAALYPRFFDSIQFDQFRHISNLHIDFVHPITAIAGSNRSGKSSVLMAIACSHYHFMRKNVVNGNVERARWGDMIRFTSRDRQIANWTYTVTFREGENSDTLRGTRNVGKKWSGVAKKEGQIGTNARGNNNGRRVYMVDLNRITPGRHLSTAKYNKAKSAVPSRLLHSAEIIEYLQYIIDTPYDVSKLCDIDDGKVFAFRSLNEYTSFNSASGEDVLINLLDLILEASNESLILIDEIEIGLHPKLQRRLIDILYKISLDQKKQFIITTHSYAIMDSLLPESRVFIDTSLGHHRAIQNISTEEALTRMDEEEFPVASIYVEDDVAKRIVKEAVRRVNDTKPGFGRLIRIVEVSPASETYKYFKNRQRLALVDKIVRKSVCILDGDKQNETFRDGRLQFPPEQDLFFLYSNKAPEKILVEEYLIVHPDPNLQLQVNTANPHCLLDKMVEYGMAADKEDAITKCIDVYKVSANGTVHFEAMKSFLESTIQF